jgi:hypothetical protein
LTVVPGQLYLDTALPIAKQYRSQARESLRQRTSFSYRVSTSRKLRPYKQNFGPTNRAP